MGLSFDNNEINKNNSMKTFRLKDTSGYFYQKDDYIGAVHAIIEALYTVFKDKSWDKIISIGIDPKTFEGVVEYEDCILEGDAEEKTKEYAIIHEDCYQAACIMDKYLSYQFSPNKDMFQGFVLGYKQNLSEFEEEYDIIQTYVDNCSDYILFIEDIASELIPGRSFTREYIEARFTAMGFSFPKY